MQRVRNHFIASTTIVAVAFLVFAGPASRAAFAQQSGGSNEPPSFILGTVSGDPGATAGIPLYFKSGQGNPIRSAHLEVEFVSNSVKFGKAEKGPVASEQDFELTVNSQELPPDAKDLKHTRVFIDIAVKDPDTKKSLPEGLLSFLDFNVPTDAKSFSIELNPIKFSAQDTTNAPVKVRAEAGKIIIALPDEPMAGCFFFTH